MRRWLRRIWITGGLLLFAWQSWTMQAHGVDASAPGLNFLPGAMVEPSAYARPVARVFGA